MSRDPMDEVSIALYPILNNSTINRIDILGLKDITYAEGFLEMLLGAYFEVDEIILPQGSTAYDQMLSEIRDRVLDDFRTHAKDLPCCGTSDSINRILSGLYAYGGELIRPSLLWGLVGGSSTPDGGPKTTISTLLGIMDRQLHTKSSMLRSRYDSDWHVNIQFNTDFMAPLETPLILFPGNLGGNSKISSITVWHGPGKRFSTGCWERQSHL